MESTVTSRCVVAALLLGLALAGCDGCEGPSEGGMAEGFVESDPDMVGLTSDGIPAIVNELVLVAEEGTAVEQVIERVEAAGGEVVGGYVPRNLFQARFPDAGTTEGAASTLDGFAAAVPNYLLSPMSPPPYRAEGDDYPDLPGSWWIDRIHLPPAWLVGPGFDGTGQAVAVLDNGFMTDHPDLPPNLLTAEVVPERAHGTFVAGVIAMVPTNTEGLVGVCPACEVAAVSYMTYPTDPLGDPFVDMFAPNLTGVAAAVLEVLDDFYTWGMPRVLNLSSGMGWTEIFQLSGLLPADQAGCWTPDEILSDLMLDSIAALQEVLGPLADEVEGEGGVIVHAAGNDCLDYRYGDIFGREAVVVVGGLGKDDGMFDLVTDSGRWVASNRGAGVDLWAPGEDVRSTWDSPLYADKSGTSASAPMVAGAIALLLETDSSLTAPQAAQIILDTAEPTETDLLPSGTGRLEVWKAMLTAVNAEQPDDRFDGTIHPDKRYGLEIVVDADLASVTVAGTDVGEWHLHTLDELDGARIARMDVPGSLIAGGQADILGLDAAGDVVLLREGVDFTDAANWDDYVFRVPPQARIFKHQEAIALAGCYSYPPYICDCWPCTSWFAQYGIFPDPAQPDDDFIPYEELVHGRALTVTWSASSGVFVPHADGIDVWTNPLELEVRGDPAAPEDMEQDGKVALEYDFFDGMPWCGDHWLYEQYTVELEVCNDLPACSRTSLVDTAQCRVD